MEPDDLYDEKMMRACARAAKRVAVVNRRYVDYGDVLQELYVWVAKNAKYILEWREQGQHGTNKLHVALYRAGHAYASKERARKTGAKMGDFFWYTPAVIEDLLPDVWEYSSWDASNQVEADMPRGKSKPGEGGNRRAMMIDLSYAITTLSVDEQRVLRDRYYTYPDMPTDTLAYKYNLTADGFRKKVDRIIGKLVDRLGGEPPFWTGGRRARSNASAQAETRRQQS